MEGQNLSGFLIWRKIPEEENASCDDDDGMKTMQLGGLKIFRLLKWHKMTGDW